MKELQLATREMPHHGAILGFGTAIKGKGICEAVEVKLNEWTVKDDFLPLELGGIDVILGINGCTPWENRSGLEKFDIDIPASGKENQYQRRPKPY